MDLYIYATRAYLLILSLPLSFSFIYFSLLKFSLQFNFLEQLIVYIYIFIIVYDGNIILYGYVH